MFGGKHRIFGLPDGGKSLILCLACSIPYMSLADTHNEYYRRKQCKHTPRFHGVAR